jgi:hypothetical protein
MRPNQTKSAAPVHGTVQRAAAGRTGFSGGKRKQHADRLPCKSDT